MYWSRASSRSKGTSLSPMLAIACHTDRLFRLGSGNPHLLKRGVAWNILYLKLTEPRNKMLVSFFSSSLRCLVVKILYWRSESKIHFYKQCSWLISDHVFNLIYCTYLYCYRIFKKIIRRGESKLKQRSLLFKKLPYYKDFPGSYLKTEYSTGMGYPISIFFLIT